MRGNRCVGVQAKSIGYVTTDCLPISCYSGDKAPKLSAAPLTSQPHLGPHPAASSQSPGPSHLPAFVLLLPLLGSKWMLLTHPSEFTRPPPATAAPPTRPSCPAEWISALYWATHTHTPLPPWTLKRTDTALTSDWRGGGRWHEGFNKMQHSERTAQDLGQLHTLQPPAQPTHRAFLSPPTVPCAPSHSRSHLTPGRRSLWNTFSSLELNGHVTTLSLSLAQAVGLPQGL